MYNRMLTAEEVIKKLFRYCNDLGNRLEMSLDDYIKLEDEIHKIIIGNYVKRKLDEYRKEDVT